MDKRRKNMIVSAVVAVALIIIFYFGYKTFDAGSLNRIFVLLGGNFMGGGYIQMVTYFAFTWGILEVTDRMKAISYQSQGFSRNLLITDNDFYVMPPEDVSELMKEMDTIEEEFKTTNQSRLLVVDIIKKVAIKFGNSKSIPEAIDVVTNQIRINREKADGEQSIIRYLAWVIPSVGFIGTVLGISQAMGKAGEIDGSDVTEVTDVLSIAFDTTLMALILSVILMYLYNSLEAKESQLHTDLEEYVNTNLINRLVLE